MACAALLAGCSRSPAARAAQNIIWPCAPHSAHQSDVRENDCACDCGWRADDAGVICVPSQRDGGTSTTSACIESQRAARN